MHGEMQEISRSNKPSFLSWEQGNSKQPNKFTLINSNNFCIDQMQLQLLSSFNLFSVPPPQKVHNVFLSNKLTLQLFFSMENVL